MPELRMVSMSGSPYDMGYQHGTACKDLIGPFMDVNMQTLIYTAHHDARVDLTTKDIIIAAERCVSFIKAQSPSFWDEIRGIADGSGTSPEEIVAVNCFCDFQDFFMPRVSTERLLGCTTFAVGRERSETGKVLIGQTVDLLTMFKEYGILLFGEPSDGPSFICYSFPGVLGLAGLSDQGMAVVINRLNPNDGRDGVPLPVIVRSILSARDMSRALDAILRSRRASGNMYLLNDSEGSSFAVETTATDYVILDTDEGIASHTNHYVAAELRPFAAEHRPHAANTITRLHRSRSFLRSRNRIGLDDLKKLAGDHLNYPTSICRHPRDNEDPRGQTSTVATLLMQPEDLMFHCCPGNACDTEFIDYDLKKLRRSP